MNFRKLKQQLILHEGIRLKPYMCPSGRLTIGVGRNLDDRGITADEAHFLLENDLFECKVDLLTIFKEFLSFPEQAQHAFIDMRFNLGPAGFRSFRRMIEAAKYRMWPTVAAEMIQSRWYSQVGTRGVNLVEMIQEVIDESK